MQDGRPLKKPLSLMTNSFDFAELMRVKCKEETHNHRALLRARHSLVSNLSHRICQCGIAKLWHGQPHLQSGHFPELSHRIKACPAAAPGKKETIHYGAAAISLKGKVKPAVASTLKRIHQKPWASSEQ